MLQTSAQIQAKTRFSPTNPGCQWLGCIQPISQLPFSCWSCNTYPRWHRGKAGRETLSYQTSKSSKCQTCFASSIKKLCVLFVCLFVSHHSKLYKHTDQLKFKWRSGRETCENLISLPDCFSWTSTGLCYTIITASVFMKGEIVNSLLTSKRFHEGSVKWLCQGN